MNRLMICVAAAMLAIDVGWQRLPEGGTEYIIQLDPQTLETLRSGKPLQSDIPPAAGEVRSYRITVGTEKLPRDTPFPAKRAVYVEQSGAAPADKVPQKATPPSEPEAPAKPWLPLTCTLLGLFASLSANVYLGWIAWDLRGRYLAKCRAGA
jgi:hypothetical protein